MHWFVGLLCWVAVALTLLFAICRMLGLWSHTSTWFRSTTEEKSNLTRCGIYNANGFLVKMEPDDYGGENFHRFDTVDSEYSMNLITKFPVKEAETNIPPQPLRPAPNIVPQEKESNNLIDDITVDIENKFQEKSDSFYHYNISTAMTRSLISTELSKELGNQEASKSTDCNTFSPLEKIEKALNTDQELEVNDWNTRKNLNIYKKPEYISTNPFLANGNQINCQFNPFHESYSQPYFKKRSLSDDLSASTNELNNDLLAKRALLKRKSSFESYNNDDGTTASSSSQGSIVKRAISCDSVSSDTSLGPLDTPPPTVTGQLCISLRCFRINSNDSLLAVNVIEGRNLIGENPDTFVGIFLSPDHQGGHFKSKICRGTNCPSFNETFLVDIGKTNRKIMKFHIYEAAADSCTLIGEADLSLQDACSYKQPVTTWLTLTDTEQGGIEFGELMLSTSYLPTAERLTLILTRARRLPNPIGFNFFIKVYLLRNGKKVAKKRSSIKRNEISTTFNEAFIFSVPPQMLSSVQLRVTLVYFPIGIDLFNISQHQKIGHILLGQDARGKAGNHWNQMVTALRKPVTMWHALRRPHE